MNGLKLLTKELQIKPAEKTEAFIKEWKELKKKEWERNPNRVGINFFAFFPLYLLGLAIQYFSFNSSFHCQRIGILHIIY